MTKAMFKKRLTRSHLEALLGGNFQPVEGRPGMRHNRNWTTWLELYPNGRRYKVAKRKGLPEVTGRTWADVASVLHMGFRKA